MTTENKTKSVGTPGGLSTSGIVVVIGASALVGAPTLLAMVITVALIANDSQRHWQQWARWSLLISLVCAVSVWLSVGNAVAFHFSGFIAWWSHPSLSPVVWMGACMPALPIGVPVGVLLGSLVFGMSQAAALGAEWHPLERRRKAVLERSRDAAVRLAMTDYEAQRSCSSMPLGIVVDGDLAWNEGLFA